MRLAYVAVPRGADRFDQARPSALGQAMAGDAGRTAGTMPAVRAHPAKPRPTGTKRTGVPGAAWAAAHRRSSGTTPITG